MKLSKKLWKDLVVINGLIISPCAIRRDFNTNRFEDEKLVRARNTRSIRKFSRTINDLSLIDLQLHGGTYMVQRHY